MRRKIVFQLTAVLLLWITALSGTACADTQRSVLSPRIMIENTVFLKACRRAQSPATEAELKQFVDNEAYEHLLNNLQKKYGDIEKIIAEIKIENPELGAKIREMEEAEQKNFPVWLIWHEKEVAVMAYALGREMGFDGELLEDLLIAARFHDIGKSGILDTLVNGENDLSKHEKEIMRNHVRYSYDVMIRKGLPQNTALYSRYHHKNFDGSGYPGLNNGIKGDQIPLGARILRVADSFSAILGLRPYFNRNRTMQLAVQELRKYRGRYFDPAVIENFLSLVRKYSDVSPEERYDYEGIDFDSLSWKVLHGRPEVLFEESSRQKLQKVRDLIGAPLSRGLIKGSI